MNWTERKTIKQARELVAGTRKLLRVNRDILDKWRADEIISLCNDLDEAIAKQYTDAVGPLAEKLERVVERMFPRPKHAGLSENVEVLLVAVIVAMAVRSFFLQPFKIPTGSMQPTLYGIIQERVDGDGQPSFPRRIAELLFLGKSYNRGGVTARGDHIFVDRFTYHFRKPHRGEVIVFDTANIPGIPESSRGKFYIKRLIGLEGDTIQIQPPCVVVNGSILDGRPAFKRIYSKSEGYHGYTVPDPRTFPPPQAIRSADDVYKVPPRQLFALGDNSPNSQDGRYWGAVPMKDLVGKAVFVYWPFTKRFGLID